MALEVVMPRLGWNMEEGALAGWRRKDGDSVTAGEILFEVESDKAIQEVEALESGILRIPPDTPRIGTTVPVGTLLAYLLAPGEDMPAATPVGATRPVAVAKPAAKVEGAGVSRAPTPPASAGASGPGARHPAISPRAVRVARELGVDWSGIRGSGRTGRIVERDIRSTAASSGRVRVREPASATLVTEADATELVRLRGMFVQRRAAVVPSYSDMLILASALALKEHPDCNVSLAGEAVVSHQGVNVGLAVDTERGLVVPVVRDAQKMSLLAIAEATAGLAERARGGRAGPTDLGGSTFTITNLGMYDIDAFTPVINLPDSAILGVGRIVARQVVTNAEAGTLAIRHMMFLSLTFDGRLMDAAPAARLLQAVKRYVEQPYLWLAGG